MLSNIVFSDDLGGIVLHSDDVNNNLLLLYPNSVGDVQPIVRGGTFYGGPADTSTSLSGTPSYLLSGPIYFEAKAGGDWALGYNRSSTDLKSRQSLGGASPNLDFPDFNGGAAPNCVLQIYSTVGGSGQTYELDYRILVLEAV
jgi:hypothetical protein